MSEWIPDVIAAGALALSAVGFIDSRRRARAADRAAVRSEQAARDSADAAQRSADAAERQLALAEAKATESPVPWAVEHVASSKWHLINRDELNHKYDVRVEAFPGMRPLSNLECPATVSPGSALRFIASAVGRGERGRGISVTWRDTPGGPVRGPWEHPLSS
ncbi:MAG: hypothetical protein ACJ74U_10440 [Jatrophihabitantaceae bacterium]